MSEHEDRRPPADHRSPADRRSPGDQRPLADRRAEAGGPIDADDEPDFAAEHEPSETDPPQMHDSPVGGQDEGYEPPTRV